MSYAFGKNLYTAIDRGKDIYRWDPATHKFVVDDRFLLPMDKPDDASPFIFQTR